MNENKLNFISDILYKNKIYLVSIENQLNELYFINKIEVNIKKFIKNELKNEIDFEKFNKFVFLKLSEKINKELKIEKKDNINYYFDNLFNNMDIYNFIKDECTEYEEIKELNKEYKNSQFRNYIKKIIKNMKLK